MAKQTKNPPLHKIRIGAIQADIWEQVREKGQPFLTVSFTRSYKNKSDEWKNGNSFSQEHLDALMDVTLEAKEWMRQHRLSKARAA